MATSTRLPNPIPRDRIAGPLAEAEDALARLDERLRGSSIAKGFVARTHFLDAAASLALDGAIVSLEDLVLHDARLDIRAPTPELTRAHAVLRARRRIATADPGWALTAAGLDALRGRGSDPENGDGAEGQGDHIGRGAGRPVEAGGPGTDGFDADDNDDRLDAELAALDAVLARSDRLLADDRAIRSTDATPKRCPRQHCIGGVRAL